MISANHVYKWKEEISEHELRFIFISNGKAPILKVVLYREIIFFNSRPVFNLGFGSYDSITDFIIDDKEANNGDHYSVFNTVLKTIPRFFELFPHAGLLIMGSDDSPEFKTECQLNCVRNCGPGKCRKFRRRMTIYQNYLHKFWEILHAEYQFFGINFTAWGEMKSVPYTKLKCFDYILLVRRK